MNEYQLNLYIAQNGIDSVAILYLTLWRLSGYK